MSKERRRRPQSHLQTAELPTQGILGSGANETSDKSLRYMERNGS